MAKCGHTICERDETCIYVVDGMDVSAEGLRKAFDVPVPFTLSNLGDLAITVSEALPTLPIRDAAKIAAYLDSLGYCRPTF